MPSTRSCRCIVGWLSIVTGLIFVFSVILGNVGLSQAFSDRPVVAQVDLDLQFSARLIWRVGKWSSKAQLFVKGDRYRIEHMGGIKTDLGYATVTIVRLDKQEVWYVLSQQRLVMAVPLTIDYLLPLSVRLDGEIRRSRIGDAVVGEQPAILYEVEVQRGGRRESYFEWVDESRNLLLKLVSQGRDWSVEYHRVVQSKQPDYFFETPLGYKKFDVIEKQAGEG